jgi:hypothetical protein
MIDDVNADALGTPRFVALHSWRGVVPYWLPFII